MQTLRLSDILGPIMIGPSSSHTAGALRIASMTRRLCTSRPVKAECKLYGSFAHTYRGHGTDRALAAGLLGMNTDDERIRESLTIAKESGLDITFTPLPDEPYDHPNTVTIELTEESGKTLSVTGESIGGGAAQLTNVNGVDLVITGEITSIVISQRDVKGVLAHIARTISEYNINIATTRMYREQRGERAFTIMEVDGNIPSCAAGAIANHPQVLDVRIIPVEHTAQTPTEDELTADEEEALLKHLDEVNFDSAAALIDYCESHNVSVAEAFYEREATLSKLAGDGLDINEYLDTVWEVMKASATQAAHSPRPSMGGLVGGESKAVMELGAGGILDTQMSKLVRYALGVLETNASMGRIVAAPTAGASGIVPAVLLTLQETRGLTDEQMRAPLLVAAALGYIVSRNATVSGAQGGCQAETGTASAMAAGAATFIGGGSTRAIFAAGSNALCNLMGLVCDPIAGLVEAPCQKRNVGAASNALVCAQIALAGVENLVDFDQTTEAMYKVGRSLPFELRESALGGIAATPSACVWCESFRNGTCGEIHLPEL